MKPRRRSAALALAFVLSRVLLDLLGLPFEFELDWMFLPDPADLKDRLWESLVWFHAFPPGMALFAGILLKTGSGATLAKWCFVGVGLVLTMSMYWLLRRVVHADATAWAIAFGFALTPPVLFLENVFLYDYPAAALLCVAALLFVRATEQSTRLGWLSFGMVLTALGFLRSAFHPAWLFVLLIISVLLGRTQKTQRLLALVPATLLVGWLTKNAALFGIFGMTSWAPANLVAVTTRQMNVEERDAWIREGRLSRFAGMSVFEGPAAYGEGFAIPGALPPQLTSLTKPSSGSGNYNHWLFLEVNAARGLDSMTYIEARPVDYLATVATKSVPQYFGAITRWHPRDGKPGAPHEKHRALLGWWERSYERFMHPFSPFGVYLLFPLIMVLAARKTWRAYRRGAQPLAALGVFCLLHIVVLSAAGCLFTWGECARYRLMVEPLLWVMTAWVFSKRATASTNLAAV